ncbi:hypothetical protein PG995_004929 [Apiospora arundinis]
MHLTKLFFVGTAALAPAVVAYPLVPIPESVPQCTRDSLYDLFHEEAHTAKASSYCSKLVKAGTATVTSTVPFQPTTVYAQTTTVTPATIYVTLTDSAQVVATVTSVVYTTITVPTTVVVATSTVVSTATNTLSTTAATSIIPVFSEVTTTVTDFTITRVQTDRASTTFTAAPDKKKREVKKQCGKADWLTTALSNGPSKLSSACSCLLSQASVTVTVTSTGAATTQTSLFTDVTTAVGTRTATVTSTATDVTVETSTTRSTATIDATATESMTLTVTETKSLTTTSTVSYVFTMTSYAVAFVTTTTTATATATFTPYLRPQCSDLASPYTAPRGHRYELLCDKLFTLSMVIETVKTANFQACLDLCDTHDECIAVNYLDRHFGTYQQCNILKDRNGMDGKSSLAQSDPGFYVAAERIS